MTYHVMERLAQVRFYCEFKSFTTAAIVFFVEGHLTLDAPSGGLPKWTKIRD
jgi:hypothetical protein